MNLPPERTLGDGIDSSLLKPTESLLSHRDMKINIRHSSNSITFTPIEPKCQIFNLKPVYVSKERKQPKCLIRKPKEPKFVPYEPYKGAVEPIVAHKVEVKRLPVKNSKNNIEIQELVTQMSEMRAVEMSKAKEEAVQNDEPLISHKQWQQEKLAYETDIKNLQGSNAHLENQIKFQTQVNSELKTLLVAAVGEDLESRVQHLTEDKLQLARALLNSANHLTSHQEQTEWLSGQCEVWRSKFLASSLMVEELARWKSALSSSVSELQEVVKKLLDERYRVQKKCLKTCCFLQTVRKTLGGGEEAQLPELKTSNIVDLSHLNCSLSQNISELVGTDKEDCDTLYEKYAQMSQDSFVEKAAMKLLQNPVTVSNKQDAICSALMDTALSLGGGQIYLKSPSQTSCCPHCTGEVKNI